MPTVTKMPEVNHPAVMGTFNMRNKVVPLVDLAVWLGKERIQKESPKVIVTEFNKVINSFLVSGVTRIHRISWEEVEPPDKYVSMVSGDSITGVVKMSDRIVFILDMEKVVADINPDLGLKLDLSFLKDSDKTYGALVADDSTLIRDMLKDLLQKARFQVEATTNGRDCWERLQEIKATAQKEGRSIYDYLQVVIADIEMPSIDGLNLTKRIREDPDLKDMPVILFSSLITDKLRHKGESVGADDQISKPEVTELAMRTVKVIRRKLEGVVDEEAVASK